MTAKIFLLTWTLCILLRVTLEDSVEYGTTYWLTVLAVAITAYILERLSSKPNKGNVIKAQGENDVN